MHIVSLVQWNSVNKQVSRAQLNYSVINQNCLPTPYLCMKRIQLKDFQLDSIWERSLRKRIQQKYCQLDSIRDWERSLLGIEHFQLWSTTFRAKSIDIHHYLDRSDKLQQKTVRKKRPQTLRINEYMTSVPNAEVLKSVLWMAERFRTSNYKIIKRTLVSVWRLAVVNSIVLRVDWLRFSFTCKPKVIL